MVIEHYQMLGVAGDITLFGHPHTAVELDRLFGNKARRFAAVRLGRGNFIIPLTGWQDQASGS